MNFMSPTTILVSGQSGTGKSNFVRRVLENQLFDVKPTKIVYCYGVWNDIFDTYKNVTFVEGLPSSFDEYFDGSHIVIVLDDLQSAVANSGLVESLWTRLSHHKNATCIYINQNLFYGGKNARCISVNSHYTVLFPNARAATQIKTLATQTGLKNLPAAFQDVVDTTSPYPYLVVNLAPSSDRQFALSTKIFPGEDPIIYQ